MLIPDNIHPDQTIYLNGAFVLKAFRSRHVVDLMDLYMQTITERQMSMPVFILCLDWLYLLNLVMLDDHGKVILCT